MNNEQYEALDRLAGELLSKENCQEIASHLLFTVLTEASRRFKIDGIYINSNDAINMIVSTLLTKEAMLEMRK